MGGSIFSPPGICDLRLVLHLRCTPLTKTSCLQVITPRRLKPLVKFVRRVHSVLPICTILGGRSPGEFTIPELQRASIILTPVASKPVNSCCLVEALQALISVVAGRYLFGGQQGVQASVPSGLDIGGGC